MGGFTSTYFISSNQMHQRLLFIYVGFSLTLFCLEYIIYTQHFLNIQFTNYASSVYKVGAK